MAYKDANVGILEPMLSAMRMPGDSTAGRPLSDAVLVLPQDCGKTVFDINVGSPAVPKLLFDELAAAKARSDLVALGGDLPDGDQRVLVEMLPGHGGIAHALCKIMTNHPAAVADFLKVFGAHRQPKGHFGYPAIDVNAAKLVTEGSAARRPTKGFWIDALGDRIKNAGFEERKLRAPETATTKTEVQGVHVSRKQTSAKGSPRSMLPAVIAIPNVAAASMLGGDASAGLGSSFFHQTVHAAEDSSTPELMNNDVVKALIWFKWYHSCRDWRKPQNPAVSW